MDQTGREIIEVIGLTKIYYSGVENDVVELHALNDVNFTIKEGESVAIMGPSGSGKSTTMNMLGCLDTPTRGIYKLDGKDVSKMSNDDLADLRNRVLGFVFQGFNLLPRYNAVENVELPLVYSGVSAKERRERAFLSLDRVGLSNRAKHRPSQMSGGQQQRVAIARALVGNAPIILADEPTGNLDTKTSHEIMNLLTDLNNEGKTVIIVTHEPDIAEYTKRVLHFRDGKLESDERKG
jgi:putative ABC transport system ATP-binding protein